MNIYRSTSLTSISNSVIKCYKDHIVSSHIVFCSSLAYGFCVLSTLWFSVETVTIRIRLYFTVLFTDWMNGNIDIECRNRAQKLIKTNKKKFFYTAFSVIQLKLYMDKKQKERQIKKKQYFISKRWTLEIKYCYNKIWYVHIDLEKKCRKFDTLISNVFK